MKKTGYTQTSHSVIISKFKKRCNSNKSYKYHYNHIAHTFSSSDIVQNLVCGVKSKYCNDHPLYPKVSKPEIQTKQAQLGMKYIN